MIKLSVVIITFNEEKNIERCIKSVKPIADEIIIVDSFSTDKTVEISNKYNARVFQKEWMGYSKQKNYANSLTKNFYVLSIDADEELSEQLIKSILTLKENGFNAAYKFNRLNNYCGKWIRHTSWYPDTKLRIWNKNEGQWDGYIHETIKFSKVTHVSLIKGDLLHYSFKTISNHISQANKFSDLSAESKFLRGEDTSILKIILSPFFKFVKEYFIKLGFLDGVYGFAISIISSHETFLKYIKLYQKNHS